MTKIAGMPDSPAPLVGNIASRQPSSSPSTGVAGGAKDSAGATASYEVSLSGGAARKAPDVYEPPKNGVGGNMSFNYWSSGETTSLGTASGPTRLEYNVYRPDGIAIDGSTIPYKVSSTGEPLTPEVKSKLDAILLDVTKQRIAIYRAGKDAGLSVSDIRDKLIAFDKALPQPYKALVGTSYMTDPATRYVNPTHDEVMGGARQSE